MDKTKLNVKVGQVIDTRLIIGTSEYFTIALGREFTEKGQPSEISAVSVFSDGRQAKTVYNEASCPEGYQFHDANLRKVGI